MDDNTILFVMYTGGWLMLLIIVLRPRKPKHVGDDPVCDCEHRYGFHSPEDGRCSRLRKIESKWDSYGDPIGYEYIPCECHFYDGPVPAINPQIMRELTNPSPSVEPYSQDK